MCCCVVCEFEDDLTWTIDETSVIPELSSVEVKDSGDFELIVTAAVMVMFDGDALVCIAPPKGYDVCGPAPHINSSSIKGW